MISPMLAFGMELTELHCCNVERRPAKRFWLCGVEWVDVGCRGVEVIVGVCAGPHQPWETCATQASADPSADVSVVYIQLSQLSIVSCIANYLAERHWYDDSECNKGEKRETGGNNTCHFQQR